MDSVSHTIPIVRLGREWEDRAHMGSGLWALLSGIGYIIIDLFRALGTHLGLIKERMADESVATGWKARIEILRDRVTYRDPLSMHKGIEKKKLETIRSRDKVINIAHIEQTIATCSAVAAKKLGRRQSEKFAKSKHSTDLQGRISKILQDLQQGNNYLYHNKNVKAVHKIIKLYAEAVREFERKLPKSKRIKKKAYLNDFKRRIYHHLGVMSPESMHMTHKIEVGATTYTVEEKLTELDSLRIPLAYLRFREQEGVEVQGVIDELESISTDTTGYRSSSNKKGIIDQYVPINAHRDTTVFKDEAGNVLGQFETFTSGSFAAHHDHKKSIPELNRSKQSANNRKALEKRKEMVFSQAVTVLAEALRYGIQNDRSLALMRETHKFHFQATSLLSHFGGEPKMIEDMQWAMKALENCEAVFEHIETTTFSRDQNGKLIIHIPLPKNLQPLSNPVGISTHFFIQGVNQAESLSEIKGDVKKAHIINYDSWEKYQEVYEQVTSKPTAYPLNEKELARLDSLHSRIDMAIKRPKSRNTQLLHDLTEFATLLGIEKLTVCKSGKDRTGMKVIIDKERAFQRAFEIDEPETEYIAKALKEDGLRMHLLWKNVLDLTYAFNAFVSGALPSAFQTPTNRTPLLSREVKT